MKDAIFYQNLAHEIHANHFRRGGAPYVTHLQAAVDILTKRGEQSVIAFAAAWLHDSVEDKLTTIEQLSCEGAEWEVLNIVELLTKKEGVDYFVYLHNIKQNEIAKRVKIADMLANLSDNPTDKQIKKYAIGLQFLLE